MYTVGAIKVQKPSNAKSSPSKKQSDQKKDDTSRKSAEELNKDDYVKALRGLKVEWLKYAHFR